MSFSLAGIRHLLIDLDGVLYRGRTALPGAEQFIRFLQQQNTAYRLVSNNATMTPQQYVEKLAGMGIDVPADNIVTSALATRFYLEEQEQSGKKAFVIGEKGLLDAVSQAGLEIVSDRPADWVIIGLDRHATYHDFEIATLALESGARLLASNADASFPTEQGLVPGAGALLAVLTTATGMKPIVVGKPEPLMLELAMRQMRGSRADTAMLGDRLDTDIEAANRLGIPSILILTGVSKRSELHDSPWRPDLVVNDLSDLEHHWREAA